MNNAVYAGSFDPFTNGHLTMVLKCHKLFDQVYVLIATNSNKKRCYDANRIKEIIEKILSDNNIKNVEVIEFNGLVADFCRDRNVQYLIRGLRNNMDYNYEENIAEINKLVNPDIESIYFRAENDLERTISSSMVKELYKYDKDISMYVPKEILEYMSEKKREESIKLMNDMIKNKSKDYVQNKRIIKK
jgi:pantetheine-phosphate adenylyltransferase